MSERPNGWVEELPAEITVSDVEGTLLEMNLSAAGLFEQDGGLGLLGKSVLDCHPQDSRQKLEGLMTAPVANIYFSTEDGEKRFFFQSPWYRDGSYAGYVEISFPVPEVIPHFMRG